MCVYLRSVMRVGIRERIGYCVLSSCVCSYLNHNNTSVDANSILLRTVFFLLCSSQSLSYTCHLLNKMHWPCWHSQRRFDCFTTTHHVTTRLQYWSRRTEIYIYIIETKKLNTCFLSLFVQGSLVMNKLLSRRCTLGPSSDAVSGIIHYLYLEWNRQGGCRNIAFGQFKLLYCN